MPHASAQSFNAHLQVLFDAGTCAGLTDGELVERFRANPDEGGERAFEVLVARHGPMVSSVCRNLLKEPNAAHDAFQAVFLVLARRAGSIRKTESIASWLYGVALRVAARAHVSSIRRQVRDRRTIAAAESIASARSTSQAMCSIERDDGAAIVHQEVERLPEKYRAPVVLCYLEGLTHDEAAARLCWPVGTVRSRLARAQDALRTRLTRRGVTASSTLAPLAAWLIGEQAATAAAAAAVAPAVPVHVSASLARTATQFAIGQTRAAGTLPASLALAQGVLTTMILKKLTIVGCISVSLAVAAVGGGALVVRTTRAQDPKPAPATAPVQRGKLPDFVDLLEGEPKFDQIDPLLLELVAASRHRVDAQRAYYEEGRITVDRFIDACLRYEEVKLLAAKTEPDRMAIRKAHVELLKEIENREAADLEAGRGTAADLAEARQSRLKAEYERRATENDRAEKAAMLHRLSELERKVDQLIKQRDAR